MSNFAWKMVLRNLQYFILYSTSEIIKVKGSFGVISYCLILIDYMPSGTLIHYLIVYDQYKIITLDSLS